MKESTIVKPQKETKIEENKNQDLFEDFKNEVFSQTKRNTGKIVLISTLIIIIFGMLGVASYQIFFKPEKIDDTKTASEKIESRPEIKEETSTKEEPKSEVVTPPTPASTPTPQPTEVSYTVQSGDTWSSIANSNDMTSTELMKYNGASGEDLQIGQTVKIPKK